MEFNWQYRLYELQDWATILFVACFALLAVTRNLFENRFHDYLRLIINDKYLKIYKDRMQIMSWFNILLFVIQMISFSFFIVLCLRSLEYIETINGLIFLQVTTVLTLFILSKYLMEKLIALAFGIEEFTEQFNLQKVSYRTLLGLWLLPLNIILYFNEVFSKNTSLIVLSILLIINVFVYLKILKKYQSIVLGQLFYFILYLCTLEIAPYYFIYYWFAP